MTGLGGTTGALGDALRHLEAGQNKVPCWEECCSGARVGFVTSGPWMQWQPLPEPPTVLKPRGKRPLEMCVWGGGGSRGHGLKPNAAPHTGIYRKQHLHKRIQQPQPPNGHQQMS